MAEPLGILLLSGTYERAHYALMLATGAAAMGRPVVLFATNEGCRALLPDWRSLANSANDDVARSRGVAGMDELREAALDLGVRLLACDSGLALAGLSGADLITSAEVAGIPTLLAATAGGQIVTL